MTFKVNWEQMVEAVGFRFSFLGFETLGVFEENRTKSGMVSLVAYLRVNLERGD